MTVALPPLEREPLLAAASAASGLDDWGSDTGFLDSLDILLADMRTTADLNEIGVATQVQDILRLLINRLGFTRDLREHPEILDEELVPPIVILGLPRTGTSKLQRTIASDPGMQRLEVWRLLNPAPMPGDPQTRIAIGEQFEAMLRQAPEFMARHPMEAREPDEDLWLMELTFDAPVASHRLHLPNHRKWIADRQESAYAYLRTVLQYLQWQDGGARGRPWVLKSPMHIGQVAVLHGLFPDATFVQCHRDVYTVLGSYCSLIEVARGMNSDVVDLPALGPDFAQFWGGYTARNLEARKSIPDLDIFDVDYTQIRDDINGVVTEIYRRAGRPITDEAQAAFDAYNARRPEGHFGAHEYKPTRWGVTPDLVRECFTAYLAEFPELAPN
ncbi:MULTISPECIES: sulfotransferase family protein [Mycobacterium]|uniref:Sulfotransferase n=1 Tax=Mycobacterium kiyosense TaxID=2871094 RepID=A0A9P3USQ1_9MYCO|nr:MULTISPECIES: sulfotransferase [Mycobacterium]BDB44271.1 putative sulfotransferase [Mycobacterium kiyosense]BDE15805.1 putative sulfotransferase [Mycobacterium sp. 20KCMC460]GLB80801.1 putative sulfotransferase [Mycobacterium kiyosense]GLB87461.1 putative sulfotransferase [Mycobacterium kiyosense]GLB93281.1 putative sulfotransferase [Mycobacterium kiyosense]